MATVLAQLSRPIVRISETRVRLNARARSWSSVVARYPIRKFVTGAGLVVAGSIVFVLGQKYAKSNVVHAAKIRKQREDELQKAVRLTMRERRFVKFASVEYDGQLYMTPQDFLDSVIESEPRPRHKRRVLSDKELEVMRNATPSLRHGSSHMFRNLRDKGILSYTEYLFLLSILTKPQTGFRIAFNMFDTDGNERVDKNEFLVMENIFSHAWRGRHGMDTRTDLQSLSNTTRPSDNGHQEFGDDQGLQRRHSVDTSLMIHFFGKDGTRELKYEGFRQFMENLQQEVLELEFHEFSKGHNTISELDFAKILLRYTYLDMDEYDKYLERMLDRSDRQVDIGFDEFRVFYQFLNNLDDFSIAMRMYTLADHPISKDEFSRAVKICTGTSLSTHIIDTVFALFDVDGDGQLSYKEFIAIMKDRLHRGFKSQPRSEGWEAFKFCVKQEMKAP
ncbi:calcium uptake protein 3, mitochondrial isoform X4 [Venturia canescens]|uniref:calcium uptake protein 3, mitochondrial isoform X4 n=1 Tax=Venturia canescens TaxID=32260 RepID=UPI001C9CD8D6|nr:calcium uptake protein 3, mitochondrial isoform X4 [Venturia canescens]